MTESEPTAKRPLRQPAVNTSSDAAIVDAIADEAEAADDSDVAEREAAHETEKIAAVDERPTNWLQRHRTSWTRVLAYGVLPGVALLLTAGVGGLKYQESAARLSEVARIDSVQAATEGTIKMLTYHPDTVEQDLVAAQDLMTGEFRGTYSAFTHDVVIPGSKEKRISAVATVPAAASVSADSGHATVLVFVNQTTTMGTDPPTNLVSSVRVVLARVDGRWLMSEFTPV